MNSTEPITLYGLSLESGQDINVGPYTWKTAVDLAILGIPYTTKGLTFAEIRTSFEAETGVKGITVPAIKDGDTGGWIHDSFTLAQYDKYATPARTLFPSSSVPFARFMDIWADKELGGEIVPLYVPWYYNAVDPESAEWFLRRKLGGNKAALEAMSAAASDPEAVEAQVGKVRAKLGVLEALLAANSQDGASGASTASTASTEGVNGANGGKKGKSAAKGPFLAGTERPTHADAAVYAWYAATLAIRGVDDVVGRTWRHESLPLLGSWVKAVEDLVRVEYPY